MSEKKTSRQGGQALGRQLGVFVVLAVLGVALYLFALPYLRTAARSASGATSQVVLRISMSGWQPTEVRVKRGEPVTVEIVNLDNRFHTDGGGWHNFVVEALGIEKRVPPKGTLTFTFVPERAGEYLFYCDICCGGKDNPFMQGKLVVL
ncbi:cytochrome c oxidase subunit II [Oceanithermus profundus DSM 14977]|uniref:Cytochrome c oxidase subunit II n=1 Tax=Oceanithermus profundus (strain DSM 14977 / NBRC 100410 / VKM B-2274 / 506) TaxID=670487 RepID=E4U669_OCEP5|nr:cupredoxin domain-containing protein [Oceanithermus profundus]ADR35942.1 cytochrome c oxidase subunit II [Oceanithermus profundus DSM 14977]